MEKMTASERFRRFLSGKTVDRSPAIEWAPWWHLTVNRWRTEGLPPEAKTVEDIQGFFGLDKCLQTSVSYRTAETRELTMALSRNGGYIIAPAQEIQADVPFENLCALIDTAKEL